jgi:hypothetical protein
MGKSIIRCALIGGIVVFLWYTLSWTVLPMHKMLIHKFIDEKEVATSITRFAPNDGVYVLPSCGPKQESGENLPFIFVNIKRGCDGQKMIKDIITGLIIQIVGAGLITYLVLQTKPMKYWNRVGFISLIGLVIGLLGASSNWNWWSFPASWALLEIFDILVAWFIGGAVIAKLIKS